MAVNNWGAVNTWDGGGAISVTESTAIINVVSQNPLITINSSIVIEESTQSIDLAAQDPIIVFSGIIAVEESTQAIDFTSINPIIQIGEIQYSTFFTGEFKESSYAGSFKDGSFEGHLA